MKNRAKVRLGLIAYCYIIPVIFITIHTFCSITYTTDFISPTFTEKILHYCCTMIIYIKNMVCIRCKMAVQTVMEELKIPYHNIELGRVKIEVALSFDKQKKLAEALLYYKLELMDNKKKILTEQIKTVIIEIFASPYNQILLKFSEYLSKQLQYDYTYLANIFSETEGISIERFYICYRIERVKELMLYEAMTIKEISYQLNFSSVAHLSQQFKKITGQTPSLFRKLCSTEDFVWRTCE
jgi:AraC family transcriptional regulator